MEEIDYRILVVDDDELVRDTIIELLNFMEVETFKTSRPEEVIPLIEKYNFDYIFTDIIMPGLNGIELMKLVKSRHPKTKFICISGISDIMTEEIEQLVEFSIQKPIDAETFIKKVTRLLKQDDE